MSSTRADYIAPWWTYWLHNFPHISLRFQPVDNSFQPEDGNYQQSLIFLGCVAAAGLGLNLLCLAIYLSCLCCCRKEEEEDTKKPNSCCVTWSAVAAGLLTCIAVGVGFYGNSETNDGIYQLTYSLYNANHTLGGVDSLVTGTMGNMKSALHQHLARLDEIFATRGDYVQTLQFMQQMADNVMKQLIGIPDWEQAKVDLATVAEQTANMEYYRWFSYLLLLILDLIICLLACLGLAKQSHIIDVFTNGAPTKNNNYQTYSKHHKYWIHTHFLFLQPLTIFQRSLTTMQIQIQGLLQFAVPLFPTAERDLLGIQHLLNSSEASLHQLTALLDCRGLNKDYLDAMVGVCYDGVEGVLYLCLFSMVAVVAFSVMLCAIPKAWRQIACRERDYDDIDEEDPFNPRRFGPQNPNHANLHSFCSYSSSMGSQNSLQPPAATLTNNPMSEYMNQTALFGGNPRFENVPLIGRGSPPPSHSYFAKSYLSANENLCRSEYCEGFSSLSHG
uniref:Protein tweety homolog n=1 Tax=Gouania willdenowi TaxID=441366 RepID=A0A8C5H3K2_GOUWI